MSFVNLLFNYNTQSHPPFKFLIHNNSPIAIGNLLQHISWTWTLIIIAYGLIDWVGLLFITKPDGLGLCCAPNFFLDLFFFLSMFNIPIKFVNSYLQLLITYIIQFQKKKKTYIIQCSTTLKQSKKKMYFMYFVMDLIWSLRRV